MLNARCQICTEKSGTLTEDTYFGQTVTPIHVRINGHRNKFIIYHHIAFEKIALSVHCFLVDKNQFSMEYLKLGIDLDREEYKFIQK